MSNRVEELESKVAELQAAVDGLTEELVETRERLSQLESEHGVDVTRGPDRREQPDADEESAEETTAPESEASDEATPEPSSEADDADEESSTEEESDIIVA